MISSVATLRLSLSPLAVVDFFVLVGNAGDLLSSSIAGVSQPDDLFLDVHLQLVYIYIYI